MFINTGLNGGSEGGSGGEVSANDVTETLAKQFISALEKQQITLNKNVVTDINNSVGKVNGIAKLNADGKVVNVDGTLPTSGGEWEYFEF